MILLMRISKNTTKLLFKKLHVQLGKLQRSDYCRSQSDGHLEAERNGIWTQQRVEGVLEGSIFYFPSWVFSL